MATERDPTFRLANHMSSACAAVLTLAFLAADARGGSVIYPEPPQHFGPHYCVGVAAGDLNGDGSPDVVHIHNLTGDYVTWNDGTGQFKKTTFLGNAGYRTDVELLDYDLDGDLDIFYTGPSAVYKNDGSGNFTAGPILHGRHGVAFGDVNGDGYPDVVMAEIASLGSKVYFNDKSGGFTLHQTISGAEEHGVAMADVDGDGDIDISVGNAIWTNAGNGSFVNSGESLALRFGRSFSDLNEDGFTDLVGDGHVYLNDGTGHFTPTAETIGWSYSTKVADVNGDGHMDIVTSNPGRIYLGDGTAYFGEPAQVIPAGAYGSLSPDYDVAVADLNADGYADLVLSEGGPTSTPVVYLNAVPEPVSIASGLVGLGMVGVYLCKRRISRTPYQTPSALPGRESRPAMIRGQAGQPNVLS